MKMLMLALILVSQVYVTGRAMAATNQENVTTLVARGAGIEEAQAKRAVDALVKAIHAELAAGRGVEIPELGTFSVSKRAAKTLPGQPPLAPKKTVRFAAAGNLKATVAK